MKKTEIDGNVQTEMNGNVQTFKVSLVAKGLTQTQGVDYDATFALVTKIK